MYTYAYVKFFTLCLQKTRNQGKRFTPEVINHV